MFILLLQWMTGAIIWGVWHPSFLLCVIVSLAAALVIAKSTVVMIYVLLLFWVTGSIIVGVSYPLFLLFATASSAVAFLIAKSTWLFKGPTWCIVLLVTSDMALQPFVFSFQTIAKDLQTDPIGVFGFLYFFAIVLGCLGGYAAGLFYSWLKTKY